MLFSQCMHINVHGYMYKAQSAHPLILERENALGNAFRVLDKAFFMFQHRMNNTVY